MVDVFPSPCFVFPIRQSASAREYMPAGLAACCLSSHWAESPGILFITPLLAFWPLKLPSLILQIQEFQFTHPHHYIFF